MGEETKVEKMFLGLEDGSEIVFEGIKDIQFTECVEHDYHDDTVLKPMLTLTPDREATFTAEVKYPKFWHCKNRKRYKKLLMSLGVSRNYIDWLLVGLVCRKDIFGIDFSYQELWNEVLKAMYGI